ncbi:putative GTP-binding protein 6 isoform X1 [Sinocyclocheilus grahami]|uniref:putative GTP-binding protein 6 isoform X1 n=1 Tax=Sinocyclocheilus grahami TaxID=75366 RepID=UPI0007AD561D|nr:PREDICTED: putative GTP-binding protein 6 isoform X1 [Sinocyclocheilus grahami]
MNSNKIGVLAKHVFLCRYAWRELCTKHVLGRRYMTFAKCKPIRFSQCTSKLSTAFAVAVLPARTLSLTACMFKSKNHNTDNNSLEEDENDEAEIEELFQQQIPTGIGEEEHRVFIVHPDVKWGSRKQYLTTAALQMEEAVGLVNTLYNWSVADKIILSTKTPEKRRIFGKGNFQTLTEKIRATPGVTAVFVNVERFSPSSEKELQEAWGVKVLDRYSLVLHIFRCNARTKEAKLQISLAEIPLLRSRLRNEVANLDQQGGGSRYIMGSGETLYEMQQRLLKERELKIRSALERLRRKRHLLRSQRKHRDFPIVSVMGYTNCVFVSKGKTTLIKALTADAGLQPKDQLFATLDVTVHAGQLPSHMTVLYVDTIGFLSQLPHQLIDSFSATLEDVTHSVLIIHVRDISHPETVNQKVNVLNVLKNLQIPERLLNSIIEVHNKIDLIEGYEVSDPEVIPISALKQHGLEVLKEKIEEAVVKYTGKQTMTLKVQLNSPQLAWLFKEATVQAVDNVGDDCTANVKVIISQAAYGRYRKLFQVT